MLNVKLVNYKVKLKVCLHDNYHPYKRQLINFKYPLVLYVSSYLNLKVILAIKPSINLTINLGLY